MARGPWLILRGDAAGDDGDDGDEGARPTTAPAHSRLQTVLQVRYRFSSLQ